AAECRDQVAVPSDDDPQPLDVLAEATLGPPRDHDSESSIAALRRQSKVVEHRARLEDGLGPAVTRDVDDPVPDSVSRRPDRRLTGAGVADHTAFLGRHDPTEDAQEAILPVPLEPREADELARPHFQVDRRRSRSHADAVGAEDDLVPNPLGGVVPSTLRYQVLLAGHQLDEVARRGGAAVEGGDRDAGAE